MLQSNFGYLEEPESLVVHTFGAFVYDSKIGSWSIMDSGLVYGTNTTLFTKGCEPLIFDCGTKRLINLDIWPSIQDLKILRYSILKDRLFVLHVLVNPDFPDERDLDTFVISEYTWESRTSDLRKLNNYKVALKVRSYLSNGYRRDLKIFTSPGFIFDLGQPF